MKTKFILLSIILVFINSISAQSLYMKDFYDGKSSLSLIFNRISMDVIQQQTLSGYYEIRYLQPVSNSLSVEGMVSYHNNRTENDYPSEKSGIGNIYLGINKLTESGNSNYSLGLYLPTISDENYPNIACYYHSYDLGNISKDGIILRGNYSYRKIKDSGFLYGVEVGPDFFIDTKGDSRDGVEMYIHAAGRIGYKSDGFMIFGEISNLFVVTEDPGDFKDRFLNHLGVGASYSFNHFEVGLNYKNTFEDYASFYKNGLGFNIKFFGF